MGTKVQLLMTNLEEDSNSCNWQFFYGNKTLVNGQQYNGFPPRSTADSFSTSDKDVVRKRMVEHEAVFKSQVYELHHMYRVQRNLMDDLRRKDSNRSRIAAEASCSSSPLASCVTNKDIRKLELRDFPLENNPVCARASISGVEDINYSILSCRMESFPSKNGYTSKDVEVLKDRPIKVGRKLIDLRLPADAYIDPEEKTEMKDDKVCGISNENLIEDDAERDSLRPSSGLKSTNCLADLNKPVKSQENDAFVNGYSHISCNGVVQGLKQSDGRRDSVGLSMKTSLNFLQDREPLRMNYTHSEDNGGRRGWSPQALGTGNYTSSLKSASLFRQPEKTLQSSCRVQVLSNNLHERQCSSAVNGNKIGSWRERVFIDLEADTRNDEIFCENHLENSNNSSARSSASAQVHPFLNPSEILSHNAQRDGLFGDRLHSQNSSRFDLVGNSICSNRKGFEYGSSSFYREYPLNRLSISYNHQNGRYDYDTTPKNFKNLCKDSNRCKRKFVRDMNLNVPFSKHSINEARNTGEQPGSVPWLQPMPSCKSNTNGQRDLNASYSSVFSSSKTHLDDSMRSLDPVWSPRLKSDSCRSVERRKIEGNDCSANVKVLGCIISDKTCYKDKVASPMVDLNEVFDINLPPEPAFPVSEEYPSPDNRNDTKAAASFRHQIDLNRSVSEDEDCFTPHSARSDMKVPVIDLEVPAVQEIEEYDGCRENSPERSYEKSIKSFDELTQIAAEAIVAFSAPDEHVETDQIACSYPEASENCLQLFVETIISNCENLDRKLEAFSINKGNRNNKDLSSLQETDYFESMTLDLTEMKEEEYMPKPVMPENFKPDETGPSFLPRQRPRRGNARRGRPRKDFQRDILPGLTSLARHEVSEDIQTFGGLMRATGYEWNPGWARRKNGSKRGRPRLVTANPPNQSFTSPQNPVYPSPPQPQQLNNEINHHKNVKTGLEDRSITDWGNMTRRPRRQRCPPGNNRTHVPSLT